MLSPRNKTIDIDETIYTSFYTKETEIWTTNGWKLIQDINEEDIILSLNHITQELQYTRIKEKIVTSSIEKLIEYKGEYVDLLVTPLNKLYAVSYNLIHPTYFKQASYINTSYYIPKGGYIWNAELKSNGIIIPGCKFRNGYADNVFIKWEDWLRFFGIWIADGYICNKHGKNGRQLYTLGIKQGGNNREEIKNILNNLPFKWHEYEEKGTDKSNFDIYSKQLWLYMKKFGDSLHKYIPREILDLPKEYLQIFWKYYTFGDSHKNGKGIIVSTVSNNLIDNLQEIALKLGVLCHIREAMYKNYVNKLYLFQFTESGFKNIRYRERTEIKIDNNMMLYGIVPNINKLILLKHNGKVCFNGAF